MNRSSATPRVVDRGIGWTYTVDPWTGLVEPMPAYPLRRPGMAVRCRLPTTNVSYPSVGREPATWPQYPQR